MAIDLVRKDAKENTAAELVSPLKSAGLLSPSNMSDADATKAGLKKYFVNSIYNGVTVSISLTGGGGSLVSTSSNYFLIPYQMQDGSWHCKFQLHAQLTQVSRTIASFAVNGMTHKSGMQQTISFIVDNGGGNFTNNGGAAGASQFELQHPSNTTQTYYWSGDIALNSKPTWAF